MLRSKFWVSVHGFFRMAPHKRACITKRSFRVPAFRKNPIEGNTGRQRWRLSFRWQEFLCSRWAEYCLVFEVCYMGVSGSMGLSDIR